MTAQFKNDMEGQQKLLCGNYIIFILVLNLTLLPDVRTRNNPQPSYFGVAFGLGCCCLAWLWGYDNKGSNNIYLFPHIPKKQIKNSSSSLSSFILLNLKRGAPDNLIITPISRCCCVWLQLKIPVP